MKRIILFCALLQIMLVNSCTNKTKNEQAGNTQNVTIENGLLPATDAQPMEIMEYVQWVQNPDNGFKKEKTIDDLVFSVQYKPYEYVVCEEEKKQELPDTLVKNRIAELNDMQYYDFKISLNQGAGELLKYQLSSTQQYQQRVNYFSFAMQDDIMLVEEKDTMPCVLYHFERTYGTSPSTVFLLGFPLSKSKSAQEKTLIVYDRTFNKGLIKFTFNRKDLKNLPKIKTL